jgi:putative peptidoglycan lipid II flippase
VSKRAAAEHLTVGVGLAAYSNAYQLWVFPQGIITVSLVTAVLPGLTRAAALSDFETLGADLARMIRPSAGLIVLATFGFLTLAPQLTGLAYGYGRTTPGDVQVLAQVLACFALGLPAFCTQYALTRGFYALGDARTPVLLALVVSGCNAGLCVVAVQALPPRWAVAGMAAAQTLACLAGVVCTSMALRRRIRRVAALRPRPATGPPKDPAGALSGVRLAVGHARTAVACLPGVAAAPIFVRWSENCLGHGPAGNLTGVAAGGLALGLSLLLLAGPLGVPEAAAPIRTALRRLRADVGARHRR